MAQAKISLRKLKTRLSKYLQQVKTGHTIVITERGKAVGLLVPMEMPVGARMNELVQTGLVAWNGRKLKSRSPKAKTRGEKPIADFLLEDRE